MRGMRVSRFWQKVPGLLTSGRGLACFHCVSPPASGSMTLQYILLSSSERHQVQPPESLPQCCADLCSIYISFIAAERLKIECSAPSDYFSAFE